MYLADRIKQSVTVEGTYEANAALGAAVARYRSVTEAYGNNDEFVYLLEADTGEWEIGVGKLQSATADVVRSPIRSSAGAGVGAVFPAGGTKVLSVIGSCEYMGAIADVPVSGTTHRRAVPSVGSTCVNAVAIGRGSALPSQSYQVVALLGANNSGGSSMVAIGPSAAWTSGMVSRGLIEDATHAAPPLHMSGELCRSTVDATPVDMLTAGGDPTTGPALTDVWLAAAWSANPAALVLHATVCAMRDAAVPEDPPTCAVWTLDAVYTVPPTGLPVLAGAATITPVVNTTGLTPSIAASTAGPGITVTGDAAVTLRWGATIDVLAVRLPV